MLLVEGIVAGVKLQDCNSSRLSFVSLVQLFSTHDDNVVPTLLGISTASIELVIEVGQRYTLLLGRE